MTVLAANIHESGPLGMVPQHRAPLGFFSLDRQMDKRVFTV